MYEYGKLVRPDSPSWYQVRLRSDTTKSNLMEISLDLEGDEKMLSEWEE